jgi:hypothetical protein
MRRAAALAAIALGAVAAGAPATAQARRSTCAARGSRTVVADAAVRVYRRADGGTWACAHANGRRSELGRGSEPYREGNYVIEHIHLRGSRVAYAIAQDEVDYIVSTVWLRDVRAGRNLVANVSPLVHEGVVCPVGDFRELDDLVLGPRGHLAWTETNTCTDGSVRVEVVAFTRGSGRRLLDSAPDPDIDVHSLTGTADRAFWLHSGAARWATF